MNQFTPIPGTHIAINWATIAAEYYFVTVDFNGKMVAHIEKPKEFGLQWKSNFDYKIISNNAVLKPFEFSNWRDLIFERPKQ